jgi:hypothetical protein
MAEIVSEWARVVAIVHELVSTRMPQHVWMHGEGKLCRFACTLNHPRGSTCAQRNEQSSCARRPWRYASKIAAASRDPLRPRFRAASRSRPTSVSVKYSLCLYAAFGCRRGSVRFSAIGVVSVIDDLSHDCAVRFRRVFGFVDHCEHSLRLGVQCSVAPSGSEAASWPEHSLRIPVINNLLCFVDELRTMLNKIIFRHHAEFTRRELRQFQPSRLYLTLHRFLCGAQR